MLVATNIKTGEVYKFKNMSEAVKSDIMAGNSTLKAKANSIQRVLDGVQKQAKGFTWVTADSKQENVKAGKTSRKEGNTLDDVRRMIAALDEHTGLNGSDLPLKEDKSVKKLACFTYSIHRSYKGTSYHPKSFTFSKLILSCSREALWETVKHEYAHYMALIRHGENCGHDYRFKAICKEIGAENDEPQRGDKEIVEKAKELSKYTLICDSCNSSWIYMKWCKTLTYAKKNGLRCGCGCDQFTIRQNY